MVRLLYIITTEEETHFEIKEKPELHDAHRSLLTSWKSNDRKLCAAQELLAGKS